MRDQLILEEEIMVNESNFLKDSHMAIRIDAYDKVISAWKWIHKLAEEDKYYDEYTLAVSGTKDMGVMPIAEMLMCLVNTVEEDYQRLGLPQPNHDLIEKLTKKLLETYEKHNFSGIPYLYSHDSNLNPPFTDAVCYTAGALSSLLKIKELDLTPELKEKCKDLLHTCLEWLLQAAIQADNWSDIKCMEKVKGAGWSWSSPIEIRKDNKLNDVFGEKLPPQTYFTSQVFITLQEILYDHYDLVKEHGKVENTFQTIVNTKLFLLTSIIERITGGIGWGNYLYDKTEGAKNICDIPPYILLDQDEILPMRDMSLYLLESLSYVRYYLSFQYAKVNDKIKKEFPDLYNKYEFFSDEEMKNLSKVFQASLDYILDVKILKNPCSIQIPEPLNLAKGQSGYFQSQQEAEKSYYIDGTVAYNCLNALSWYAKFFALDEKIEIHWEKNKVKIVKRILDEAFKEQSFAHCGSGRPEDPFVPSIYATRAAIASLLGWGLKAPVGTTQVAQISPEVCELVRKLYHLVEPISQVHPVKESPPSFSKEDIQPLLNFSYLIGLIIPVLKDQKKWQENLPVLFDPQKIKKGIDPQTLININGRAFLKVLSTLLTSNDKDAIKRKIDNFTEQIYLIKPLKSFLQENAERFAEMNLKERISTFKAISNSLLDTFEKAGVSEQHINDLYKPI